MISCFFRFCSGAWILNFQPSSTSQVPSLAVSAKETHFSDTELRLIAEILSATYEGKRLISTQLADMLGITRSAVSQIVNNLEKRNVVKRVADDVDRKIAYIELTEEAMESYLADLKIYEPFIERVVET